MMVLFLFMPLASGWNAVPGDDFRATAPAEHLLVLNEGVWTSGQWEILKEEGIHPLRNIRSDALLVWADEDRVTWPSWVTVEESEVAQFREPFATESTTQHYRVLLEPRLPSSGIEAVQSSLAARGLPIHSASLDVGGSLPGSFTVHAPNAMVLQPLLQTDGVLWIEPVLETKARNAQASALMESGTLDHHPFWSLGLNASGVVLGVADSGIDADHACFRNATSSTSPHAESSAAYPAVGIFGENHRKILHLNTSVDGNDTPGHSDYRHGTHVIGSLACHHIDNVRQGQAPSNGSTLAHGSTLVIQDIVSDDGWAPPPVDQLLWESSSFGGVIHSNSWGDDTTAYTERTGRFDAYAKAMPWSVAFIAPGNGGEGVLEPANGRNVVAVSASTKSLQEERWSSTAYGPTETGTDGIFLLAPGVSIQSAGGDGFWDTNNANLRSSSGTSMATPLAAGAAGIIQQLYEDGWLVPVGAELTPHNRSEIQPGWADAIGLDSVSLGDGFTPSGSLIRASLAMAASPLSEDVRNGGDGGYGLHNPYDGWGVLNLSELFDPSNMDAHHPPSHGTWVHDSYRLSSGTVDEWFSIHGGQSGNLSGMLSNPWYGNESVGPFLQTGDVFTQRFTPLEGHDVRIRLAYPAQPEPAMVDDLQLQVRLEDGTVLLADQLRADEFAPTKYYPGVVDTNNTTAFPQSNETVFGLDVPLSYLENSSYIDVDVVARFVQPGGEAGAVGLDGDALGFALVVKGVEQLPEENLDEDGDGVLDENDVCPTEFAHPQWDVNRDGCLDDDDGDGVPNIADVCPAVPAPAVFDVVKDGCLDDVDGDGITDSLDDCPNTEAYAEVDENGCSQQEEEGENPNTVKMYVLSTYKAYLEDVSLVSFNRDASEYASIHAVFCQAKTCDDEPSDSVLRFWNTSTMSERLSISVGAHIVKLDWAPDGSSIALLSADNTVSIYNKNGEVVNSFSAAASYAGDLAFNPNGTMLAVVSNYDGEVNGEIQIYNASSGALIQRLVGYITSTTAEGYHYSVDWSLDGSRLLVGGFKAYTEFDVSTGVMSKTVGFGYSYITDIAYSPDESMVAVCNGWNRAVPSLVRSGFSPSEVRVYSALTDAMLWSYTSSSSCLDVEWSPDSEFVAFSHSAYTQDGASINVFHGSNGTKAYTLSSQPPGGCGDYPADYCAKVTSVDWHPQEDYIISSQSFSDMGIYHWRLEEVLGPISEPIVWGCTSPQAYNYNPLATQNDGSCISTGGFGYDPGCTNCYGSPPALLPPLDFSNTYLGPSPEQVCMVCCLPTILILFIIDRGVRRRNQFKVDKEIPEQRERVEEKNSEEIPGTLTVGWLDDFQSP